MLDNYTPDPRLRRINRQLEVMFPNAGYLLSDAEFKLAAKTANSSLDGRDTHKAILYPSGMKGAVGIDLSEGRVFSPSKLTSQNMNQGKGNWMEFHEIENALKQTGDVSSDARVESPMNSLALNDEQMNWWLQLTHEQDREKEQANAEYYSLLHSEIASTKAQRRSEAQAGRDAYDAHFWAEGGRKDALNRSYHPHAIPAPPQTPVQTTSKSVQVAS